MCVCVHMYVCESVSVSGWGRGRDQKSERMTKERKSEGNACMKVKRGGVRGKPG